MSTKQFEFRLLIMCSSICLYVQCGAVGGVGALAKVFKYSHEKREKIEVNII